MVHSSTQSFLFLHFVIISVLISTGVQMQLSDNLKILKMYLQVQLRRILTYTLQKTVYILFLRQCHFLSVQDIIQNQTGGKKLASMEKYLHAHFNAKWWHGNDNLILGLRPVFHTRSLVYRK